jgi:hypothetical protein
VKPAARTPARTDSGSSKLSKARPVATLSAPDGSGAVSSVVTGPSMTTSQVMCQAREVLDVAAERVGDETKG